MLIDVLGSIYDKLNIEIKKNMLDGDSRHIYIYKLNDFDQNPFPLLRTFEFDNTPIPTSQIYNSKLVLGLG